MRLDLETPQFDIIIVAGGRRNGIAMTDHRLCISLYLSLDTASRAWAAASSTAGAFAPAHIAEELRASRGDLLLAVQAGGRRAHEANAPHVTPEPRGVDLEFVAGAPSAIVWRTDKSTVRLQPSHGDRWLVSCESPYRVGQSGDRHAALLVAVQRWLEDDEGDELDRALLHAHAARAARAEGITAFEIPRALDCRGAEALVRSRGIETIADQAGVTADAVIKHSYSWYTAFVDAIAQ